MFGEEMHEEIYEACWDGYKQVGVKKKGDRMVPDCVPVGSVKKESIAESGGVKVFKTDAGHIEKYGENNFAVYLDGKKQKAYDSLEAAKKALASGKEDDNGEMDEGLKPDHLKPGWMLRKDPELAKKLKDKQDIAKKRQQSYGDQKAGISVKEEAEQMDEASKYQIYHPSYSSAVQHALSQAEKQGFTVDMDDYTQKVAFGPKKPSVGKTNSFSITLMDKSGKISKKKLQMQVYGMEGGKYELNMYTEEVQLHELNKDTVYSYAKKSGKDQDDQEKKMSKAVKANDSKTANSAAQKFLNRLKGTERAEKRLNKEETTGYNEFKHSDKPMEKKLNKPFKSMSGTAGVKINEEEKPKKSFKDMKKKKEDTSNKDVKAGEKLSGKQEPIDLSPTVDNNR
jgi:hypothetical protein